MVESEQFLFQTNSDTYIKPRVKHKPHVRQRKYFGCDKKERIENIRKAINDPEYIEQAIDYIAEKIVDKWIEEKYGK